MQRFYARTPTTLTPRKRCTSWQTLRFQQRVPAGAAFGGVAGVSGGGSVSAGVHLVLGVSETEIDQRLHRVGGIVDEER